MRTFDVNKFLCSSKMLTLYRQLARESVKVVGRNILQVRVRLLGQGFFIEACNESLVFVNATNEKTVSIVRKILAELSTKCLCVSGIHMLVDSEVKESVFINSGYLMIYNLNI